MPIIISLGANMLSPHENTGNLPWEAESGNPDCAMNKINLADCFTEKEIAGWIHLSTRGFHRCPVFPLRWL
jgi:hypothetical protein